MDFSAARFTYNSPLAKKLFTIDGITRVFYGKDYISVGIKNEEEWSDLKPLIFDSISTFFDSDEPLFNENPLAQVCIANNFEYKKKLGHSCA